MASNPYANVDTSGLSGYALEYAKAKKGGASDAQAHTQANAATGGSGITQSQYSDIAKGSSSPSYTSNPYNQNYAATPYDESGYQHYYQQQQPIQQPQQQQQQPQYQTDPALAAEIASLRNAISNIPTVDNVMSSPVMQQMQQAVLGQMQQAMKSARADLAARGVLGEGSTPAAERIGQVAGHYGQQLGALIPQMMGTASQMQGAKTDALQNLIGLLSGMDQQSWQRGITEFQNYAPYYRFTAGQIAEMVQNLLNNYPGKFTPEEANAVVNSWIQGGL